ncbi:hypothetical protein [Arthrobacter sp. MDT1-65]
MIDFEQARVVAYERGVREWAKYGHRGQYMVADYGFENEAFWVVVDGAREALEGGQESGDYMLVGRGAILVDKYTEEVHEMQYLDHQDMFDAMTPVGVHPSDGDEME